MAERKVRHATVQYFVKDSQGNTVDFKTAFRNQVVDIPADQVDRLDALGATVPADQDLDRPGRMLALPESAGDSEILSWVMGATNEEVEALVRERPALAGRIAAAKEGVEARFAEQNLHLGGLQKLAEEAEAEQPEQPPVPTETPTPVPTVDNATLDAAGADLVVKGNATSVTNYISENPVNAATVLEAENRLAVDEGRDPRTSVVRAAAAAAGFTQ